MRHKLPVLLLVVFLANAFGSCAAAMRVSSPPDQRHRAGAKRGAVVFVGGYFYDPFFGPYPWWARAAYPYPYYPVFDGRAEVRVLVTPTDAAVYVDGYYAGLVDDFNGFFQRLPLTPGPHAIDLYLPGYRTAHHRLYLGPRSTYALHDALERLGPGEVSEPPQVAPPLPPPPAGSARSPRPFPRAVPPPLMVDQAPAMGSLAIRVQPIDAEVIIDGECWNTSTPGERLVVELERGPHHVLIQKPGFRSFSTDVDVRVGAMASLNVSLSAEGKD
jgi:hypothetical protein